MENVLQQNIRVNQGRGRYGSNGSSTSQVRGGPSLAPVQTGAEEGAL